MRDVTAIFQNYQECLVEIWSNHIRSWVKPGYESSIIHQFNELRSSLFELLVLTRLNIVLPKPISFEHFPPLFKLNPLPHETCRIMIQREDSSNYWDDPVNTISPDCDDYDLRFTGFFDWDEINEMKVEYYLARFRNNINNPPLTGRKALLERTSVTIFYDTEILPYMDSTKLIADFPDGYQIKAT